MSTNIHVALSAASELSPVVIGCTGGSGSRMLRDILAASCEIFMDRDCSPNSKDSRGAKVFLERDDRDSPEYRELVRRFMDTIVAQIPPEDTCRNKWFGWKRTESVHIVGMLMEMYPRLRFLHLIRDPAALVNSCHPRKIYKRERAYGNPEAQHGRLGRARFVLTTWARVNLPVWRDHQNNPRYRPVRYEDVVTKPRETIESLFDWLGVNTADWVRAVSSVRPPPDAFSRGRGVDISLIAEAAAELGYETASK